MLFAQNRRGVDGKFGGENETQAQREEMLRGTGSIASREGQGGGTTQNRLLFDTTEEPPFEKSKKPKQ